MAVFTPEQQRRFDEQLVKVLSHYPPDRKAAAMVPALRLVQDLVGHIPDEAMNLVAARLEVPPARAREVATFYAMFFTEKPGRTVLDLCTNVSCSLRGAEHLLSCLEKRLKIHAGETTPDGRVTLRETECLGSCGTAPAMLVNERFVENLTLAKLEEVLARLP